MTDRPDRSGARPDPTTDTERRLRDALRATAAATDPSPDGLRRIEDRLMTTSRLDTNQRWIVGGLSAAAAIVIVTVLAVTLGGSDGDDGVVADDSTTTTTETTTTTTTAPTTSTTATPPPVTAPESSVIYPSVSTSQRFSAASTVTNSFAEEVAGMVDPIIGDFTPVDGGVGIEQGVQQLFDERGGAETRVDVVRFDDGWFVTGATTENIVVDQPAPDATLATPFRTFGRALAFEGTVDVVLFSDEDYEDPRGAGFVMGSGTPPAGPFEGTLFFTPPPQEAPGVVIYRTLSARDGHVERFTAVRVTVSTRQTPETPDDCSETPAPEAAEDERVVIVYFRCSLDDEVLPFRRTVPASQAGVLRATLGHLFDGPSDAEQDAFITSVFPVEGLELNALRIVDGLATIDLSGVEGQVPNASAAILAFEAEVGRTTLQFSTVNAVEVLFDGSCDAYGEWSQKGPGNCRLDV